MSSKITATEFARRLSDFLNRVRYGRETFLVERGGLQVCEVRPVSYASTFRLADLLQLVETLPHPGDDYLARVEENLANQPPARDTTWDG